MARPNDAPGRPPGFDGEVSGLGLSDLIQLHARTRFSGCYRIRFEGVLGLIFFRDGDIVHAEQGGRVGEEAFYDILEWPTGHFSVEPNVVTAQRTIQKSCEHLLLDAHRLFDERRIARNGAPLPPPRPDPATTPAARAGPAGAIGTSAAIEAVRAVPGVSNAVVLTRDGKAVGEGGYEAEQLAGQALYMTMMASEFGALFQAGELRFASAQGQRHHLLLYATRSHYLGAFAHPDSQLGAVDAAIRAALSPPKQGGTP